MSIISNNIRMSLPPQMIPIKDKDQKWLEANMDALETIGRSQFAKNEKLIENYEMLKGKFIFRHYIDSEDYRDLVTQLTKEFDIPSYLRHYDIISPVVNTLSGEFQKRPDILKVRDYSESSKNNYFREKTRLLMKTVTQSINTYIEKELINMGLDPSKQDFQSQEEADQYQQVVQKATAELTPPEIQKYMDQDWMDVTEIWGEHQLEHDNQKFKRSESRRILFEDMLAADRAFKHFYLIPGGYNEEVWNTINTFYHKSPEIVNIEDGDYVGRIFYLTSAGVNNRYGHRMTEEQLLKLEKHKIDSYKHGFDTTSEGYQISLPGDTVMPFKDYPQAKFIKGLLGTDPNNPSMADDAIYEALGGGEGPSYFHQDMFQVTEAYWMSQEKVGKYVYQDSETGEVLTMLVDETFAHHLIPNLEVINSPFMEFNQTEKVNTLTWTWVNKCYKGVKINNKSLNLDKAIYLDMGPNDFQFKGDLNIYGAKLPVCGQIFNDRNGESTALVDLMKADQIGHNVAANQLYEIMQREIGRFMLMDSNFIPNNEDWGGDHNYEKLMMVARQLGVAPLDGSPDNTKGSSFAHFQVIDLDESARMTSRMNIASYFEQRALDKVGFTPQRLGAVSPSESATGVQQAVSQSFAQTETYFSKFAEFEKRCLQMSLDIAQFVQSQQIDITIMNIKSDMSRAMIPLKGSDLINAELGLYVVASQEVVRQLETMRQLFINHTNSGATSVDLATVVMSNSPNEIKAQLETSLRLQQEREQQAQEQQSQLAQQQIEVQQQIEQSRIAKEDERLDKQLANDRYIAEVKAIGTGTIGAKTPDADGSGIPDVLEIQKHNLELNKHSEDILFKRQQQTTDAQNELRKGLLERKKLDLESKKLTQEKEIKDKEIQFKEKELKSKEKVARYGDKGTANSPKK